MKVIARGSSIEIEIDPHNEGTPKGEEGILRIVNIPKRCHRNQLVCACVCVCASFVSQRAAREEMSTGHSLLWVQETLPAAIICLCGGPLAGTTLTLITPPKLKIASG